MGTGGSGTTVFSMTSLGYNANGSLNASTVNSSTWSYAYDEFMRLNTATQSGFNPFNYDYDRYGNRWHQSQTGGTTVSTPADGTTNRIASGNGITYDDLGNIRTEVLGGVTRTYTYDAENRLTDVSGDVTANYKYDAASLRVQKTTGGTSLDYYYDYAGNVSAVYNGSAFVRGEVFIGSHIATYSGGHTYFHHTNWLGSESTRTDESGSKVQDCEWYSFGELISCATNTDPYAYTPYGYAGYERDSETGLDHMQFRYYNSRIGRFIGADPLDGGPDDPQSMNKLGYVRNNPSNFTDPLGLTYELAAITLPDTPQVFGIVGGGNPFNSAGDPVYQATVNEIGYIDVPHVWVCLDCAAPPPSDVLLREYTPNPHDMGVIPGLGTSAIDPRILNPAPPKVCYSKDPAVGKFVLANTSAAQAVASVLNVDPNLVLAHAGLESLFGQSPMARNANNFFGLTIGKAFQGATGVYVTRQGGKFGVYPGSTLLESGMSFANSFQGKRVSGAQNLQQYVAGLTRQPLAFNSEPINYLGRVQSRLNQITAFQKSCK